MMRDECVATIQRELGFRQDLASAIVETLKEVQIQLEGTFELPWFLKAEISDATTAFPDEERLAVPDDFIRESETGALWLYDADATTAAGKWKLLHKDNLDVLRTTVMGAGPPIAYALDNQYFRLFPTPDAAYTIKLDYFARDTVLNNNIENKWLKYVPNLLIGLAGLRMCTPANAPQAKEIFTLMATNGWTNLDHYITAREEANIRPVMGGED